MTRRLFADAVSEVTEEDVEVDFGAFIERLIIADEYVLHSRNLQEIPYLVERFGVEPVSRLFAEDDISICVEKAHVGLIEDQSAAKDPYTLHTATMKLEQPDSSERDLKDLNRSLDHLRTKDLERVRRSVGEALVFAGDDFDSSLRTDFYRAVQTKARMYPYLENVLKRMGAAKAGQAFSFDAEVGDTVTEGRVQGTKLKIETNLEESYGLRPEFVGSAVRKAVLGLSGEVGRVNEMRAHDAVSEFNNQDVSLFGAHIDFLGRELLPDKARANLYQVIDVADVPDFRDPQFVKEIDLDTLIEVRKSDEAEVFRDWMWRASTLEKSEIEEDMDELSHPLLEKIGRGLASSTGRTMRWLVVAGAGMTAGAVAGPLGPAVGPVLGAANRYLIERLAKSSPAPLSFVRDGYKSLFKPS
jgi:hypothetical protein